MGKKILYTFFASKQKTIMDQGTCGSHICGRPGDATIQEILNDLIKNDMVPPEALIGFDVCKEGKAKYKTTIEQK